MIPKTTAYKQWNCQVIRPANCCHLIPSNRFLDGFPVPSQFAAAKLTHYSTMPHRPSDSSRPRQRLLLSGDQGGGLLTLIHKSINFSQVRFTRYSSRSSFGRVDYYSQAGKHRLDHYQRLHTPSKLLHRRIQSISRSSDDDNGHHHTGRLQRSPLIVVLKFYRYERHYVGEHGVWL